MDKNLRIGGRFVDEDDNLLVVAAVDVETCGGCFYVDGGNACMNLSARERPSCRSDMRDDRRAVIFVPTTEPVQEKPSGRTVAEIESKIADMRMDLIVRREGESPEGSIKRQAARGALVELSDFIDPPAPRTFADVIDAYGNGWAIRQRSWGTGRKLVPPELSAREATDWEVVPVPEKEADAS